uniref:Protein kinase domain-containing protein n=1 Tax=Glossina palpalis gambiensis TaxID=67801 RepID=A0A1B0B608_9MUSC
MCVFIGLFQKVSRLHAPEILQGLPYGHSADWWSLGVIACQMFMDKECSHGLRKNNLKVQCVTSAEMKLHSDSAPTLKIVAGFCSSFFSGTAWGDNSASRLLAGNSGFFSSKDLACVCVSFSPTERDSGIITSATLSSDVCTTSDLTSGTV